MKPTDRWKQLLDERLQEAITVLRQTPGLHGLIVAGGVGRGAPWPMSDIDLLPIYTTSTDPAESATQLDQRRAALVDWWAASGRAQTLDVGWLAFTTAEIREAAAAGPEHAATRITEPRWFHGMDKAYGGHAADPDDELVTAFTAWIAEARFHPAVVTTRINTWRQQAADALAEAAQTEDPAKATHLLRVSARALRMVLIEKWGERLGSMGREWTRFERMAERHGQPALAARIAVLAAADTAHRNPARRNCPTMAAGTHRPLLRRPPRGRRGRQLGRERTRPDRRFHRPRRQPPPRPRRPLDQHTRPRPRHPPRRTS